MKWRTKQWDVRQYFSSAELERAAKEAKRCDELGQEPPQEMTVNGRVIPWDRVSRKFRQDPRYECAFLQRPQHAKVLVSGVALKDSRLNQDVEAILFQVTTYLSLCLDKARERRIRIDQSGTSSLRSQAEDLEQKMSEGLTMIDQGLSNEGWRKVRLASIMVEDVLKAEEVDLLPNLIRLMKRFYRRLWNDEWQLFNRTIQHFTLMSVRLLGKHHPITNFLHISKTADIQSASEIMYQAMLDTIKKKPTLEINPGIVYGIEGDYIDAVRGRDCAVAQTIAEAKLLERREKLGGQHLETLGLVQTLVSIHREQGNCETGEKLMLEVLKIGQRSYQETGRSFHWPFPMYQGYIFFKQQKLAEAEACFQQALSWCGTTNHGQWSIEHEIPRQLEALENLRLLGLFESLPPPDWNQEEDEAVEAGTGHQSRFQELTDYEDMDVVTACDNEVLFGDALPGCSSELPFGRWGTRQEVYGYHENESLTFSLGTDMDNASWSQAIQDGEGNP